MRGTEQTAVAMNHCRTSTRARAHGKSQSSALTRLMGVAILLIAATAWPMAALAADPTVETQSNPVIVYVVLILLFAALTSGIFFASPLRGRLIPSTAEPRRRSRMVSSATMATELPPFEVQAQPIEPIRPQMQAPAWPQPTYAPQPTYPPQPRPQPQTPTPPAAAPQVNPGTPWSTGSPQARAPWTHGRPGSGDPQG